MNHHPRTRPWRARLQAVALALILGAPFGLYAALQSGNAPLAVFFFALLVLSMALTYLSG
ncbi:MAG: hypothetical protein HPY59_00535 [Anaerolineae bacterium]|nr:hypothetical protein [Anaerolineae bacterium]